MSESENPSTQEKLDVWFASLQLDKTNSYSILVKLFYFAKQKKYFFYFFFLLIFPIILYFGFFWIERETDSFWEYGFTKNEWFLFSGSYFGGVATLIGVVLTILHMKEIQARQENISSIEKDYESTTRLINKINSLYICADKYYSLKKIMSVDANQNIMYIQKISFDIFKYIEEYKNEVSNARMISSILVIDKKCKNCKNNCNIYKIKKEFNKIFNFECALRETLLNAIHSTLSLEFYLFKVKSIRDIEIIRNPMYDSVIMDSEAKALNSDKKIGEICSNWKTEPLDKLVILLKAYKEEQIKAISYPCPCKGK